MPNYNRQLLIVGSKDKMDKIVSDHVKGGNGFDFNTVVQMPKALENSERGSKACDGIKLALARINPDCLFYGSISEKMNLDEYEPLAEEIKSQLYSMEDLTKEELKRIEDKYGKDQIAEIEAIGNKEVGNYRKYGFIDWYSWSLANWGTKWNACVTDRVSDTELAIETAWEPAIPMWVKLSKQYPNIPMAILFSDEQPGEYAGFILMKGGNIDEKGMFPNQSIDAWKLSLRVWNAEDEYRFDEKQGKFVENQ